MPMSLPPSVREQFGEAAAEDFVRWLDETLQQQTVLRDEYREVLSRLDVLEERLEQLEQRLDQRFEQVNQRFEQIDKRFEQVDRRFEQIDQRFDQIDQRFEQQSTQFNERIDGVHDRIDRLHEAMRVQTRWTIGTIALFGTIVTVLLAIAEFGA